MARLTGIWCSVLAVAALASGKAIDVTKDLQSDESQVLPVTLLGLPALSSVSSSHSFSKSGSQSSSKSESYSGSHSFSKSGSYVLGQDGIPQQASHSFSASKSQSSSNIGKSSSSASSSHSFSQNGALGIPLTLSEISSHAASKSEHQSASDSSSHSFSNSAVVDSGVGQVQAFTQSGSQASSKSGLQSSSDVSSHSFSNTGAVDVGLGAVQAFSQSGSQASSNSALQSSSDSSSHSFSNSGTVATDLGAGQSFSQSGSQAASKSGHQSTSESSSNAYSNSGALDVGLGALQAYSQSGSQAASKSGHQASTQSSSNAFDNSGSLDVGLGTIEDLSQSGSEASSNTGLSTSSESASDSFAKSEGAVQSLLHGSGQQASSGSSSQAYSGSAGIGGSSQSYSGSGSTSSSGSGQQGASSTASSQSSTLSHGNSGALATNQDTSGLSGHSLTPGGILVSLAPNQETSTPLSILATGTLDSQVQTYGANDDASFTQVILPQGANYDSQNSILDSTYIRSGTGQQSQNEISESGAQISQVGFDQTASLNPSLEVIDVGSASLTNTPVASQGNRDSLVILSYQGGNEEQSKGHQENAGNSANFGTNYVLIGGRHVISENPKVTPCHVCSGGGIEHITNVGQSQDDAAVHAPISTSYQTIFRPSDVHYETSVLNGNNQQDNEDRSRVILHSTYHSLHPSGSSQNQDHTTFQGFINPTSHSSGNVNGYNTYQAGDQHDITIDRLNQFYGGNSPSYASFEAQNTHVPSRTSQVTEINKGSANNDNVVLIGNQSGGKYAGNSSASPTLLPAVENDKWTLEELIRSFNATPTITTVSQESVPVPAGNAESTITAFGGNYLPAVQSSVPVILPGSTSTSSSHSSASSQNQQSSSSSHSSSSSSSGTISTVPVITPTATYLTPVETLGNLPVPYSGSSNLRDGDIRIVQFGVPQSFISSHSTSSSEASENSQKSSSSSSSFSSSEGLDNVHQGGSGSVSSSRASSSSGSLDGSTGSLSSSQSSSFSGDSERLHHLVPSLGDLQHSIVSIDQQGANHEIVQGSANSHQASSSNGNSGHLQYIVPVFGSAGDHVPLGNVGHGVADSTSSSYSGSSGNVGDLQHSSGSISTSSSSSGASDSHSSGDSSSTSGNTGSSFFGKIKTFFKRIPTYFKSSSSSHSSSQSQASASSASSHSYSSSSSSALS
ncbi:platelet binding protein GspB-like [Anabrus simplex]|uniref:platelet binding protein GspB-like n=1 Tax=Anabrus simplex TaxID=316456 RepID=UPI0035A28ECE